MTMFGPLPALAPPWQPRRRWDPPLVLSALSLSVLGSVLVWSATGSSAAMLRQSGNIAIGLVLCWFGARLRHDSLRFATPWLYVASLLGLVAVLSPLGSTINGAHAWIRLPAGFTVQPSEFAKVAIIVGAALLLADRAAFDAVPGRRDLGLTLALAGTPLALVMLQPDLGTVLVTAATLLGILVVAGTPRRYLIGLGLSGVLTVALASLLGWVDQYQLDRLTAFARPDSGALTYGYNTQQARIAIGAGGWVGRGLFQGWQTQGGFVPFNHTDFVFSVAGEELGFLGVLLLLGLLALLLWRGLTIALRARDLFGRLVAVGVVCWFGFQAFENIGMNLGIMPVTGVPLPFVSYGGSSLFAGWIGVGLLLNVHAATHSSD